MNEMFKINDVSGQCGEVVDHAGQFLPYAHKKLGFNKPVGVNFVSDPQNAKDPLGKTGYYDPNNMEITIFVDKRHVKDILRSLSHELVHHTQNCRGEFDKNIDTGPGYAQKDPHMRKMEAEAYLLGNGFLFRDWEDHLKLKESRIMAKANKKPDGDGDGVPPWADKDDNNPDVQEEGIFAPNHYCVHHGGVQMEGKIKLGKVVAHNWNRKLKKVTKYDMQFEDGTIVENIKAEDILVTEASLEEMHHGHEAKEEHELEEGANEVSFKLEELPAHLQRLAAKLKVTGPFLVPVGDGTRKGQLRALHAELAKKVKRQEKRPTRESVAEDQHKITPRTPEEKKKEKETADSVKRKHTYLDPDHPDYAGLRKPKEEAIELSEDEDVKKAVKNVPKLAKKAQDKARKEKAEKEAKEAEEETRKGAKKAAEEESQKKKLRDLPGKLKKVVDKSKKNENWSRGNKDELLFERLIKKWTK
jgi:hypothetical protein